MKILYATSIAFSNKLANRVQVQSMAREFQNKLGDNFFLGVNYKNVDDKSIKIICFNSARSYVLAWRYLKFIKESNISHIYCREARLLFFIILFNKLFFHYELQYVYEIHAIDNKFLNGLVEKILSFWAHKLIFITSNLREIYLREKQIKKEKTIVASDGVDLKIFDLDLSAREARRKIGLPFDKKILVYTGKFKTMGMDKGISDILKSIKILNDKNILFIAVGGSGSEIKYYSDLSKKLSVDSQVKFIGLSPQEDLAIYQKTSDALLMPFPYTKHYAYYMSPLKMFEYMASKRPIIATNLTTIGEVLNNSNAIIVKPGDPGDLAKGIKMVLESVDFANKIGEKAYNDVEQYTWEKRVANILEFIACA